jgi:hypothetical protein
VRFIVICSLLASLCDLPMGKSPLATACCLLALSGSCVILVLARKRT